MQRDVLAYKALGISKRGSALRTSDGTGGSFERQPVFLHLRKLGLLLGNGRLYPCLVT